MDSLTLLGHLMDELERKASLLEQEDAPDIAECDALIAECDDIEAKCLVIMMR